MLLRARTPWQRWRKGVVAGLTVFADFTSRASCTVGRSSWSSLHREHHALSNDTLPPLSVCSVFHVAELASCPS